MENYLYRCQYCGKEYKPNRRKKQKYCSNSCRTRAFVIRSEKGLGVIKPETKKPQVGRIDETSWAGIKNAAAGNLLADGIVHIAKTIFIKEEDKPSTKGDLQSLLLNLRSRYHPINNIPIRQDGAKAFYDLETKSMVYIKNPSSYGIK